MSDYKVTVLGAGLAGCEAALWLADKGVQVDLYEQKPMHFSPAHKSEGFAELICSNSLKAERLDSASGLLKEEMRRMGSQLLQAAEVARVAAGGALAVDRDAFSAEVTRRVEECPNITVHRQPVEHIDESAPILVATGPLTDGKLADEIGALTGDERLHFYDAVAPIVTAESLDYNKVFAASRYGRGDADYLNCPFNKAEYEAFHAALAAAERAPLHDFDTGAEQSARPDPDAHGKKADTSGFIQYQWSGRFCHIHADTNGLCTKFLCFLKCQGQPVLSGIHNVIVAEIPDICVNISQNLFCIRMDCMHQTHLGCLCQCRRIVHQGAFHVSHHMICTGQKFCNLRSQKVFVLPFLLHIFIKTDIAGKGDCCILFQFLIPLLKTYKKL